MAPRTSVPCAQDSIVPLKGATGQARRPAAPSCRTPSQRSRVWAARSPRRGAAGPQRCPSIAPRPRRAPPTCAPRPEGRRACAFHGRPPRPPARASSSASELAIANGVQNLAAWPGPFSDGPVLSKSDADVDVARRAAARAAAHVLQPLVAIHADVLPVQVHIALAIAPGPRERGAAQLPTMLPGRRSGRGRLPTRDAWNPGSRQRMAMAGHPSPGSGYCCALHARHLPWKKLEAAAAGRGRCCAPRHRWWSRTGAHGH